MPSVPESGDPFSTNNSSQYPGTYTYHPPTWQQSNQASSRTPHGIYDTTSHVEATTGPDARVHPLSSREAVYDSRAYGDPHRLALPMEPRPPARVDAGMSSSGHRESTTQIHNTAPMVIIPDHASAHREWSDHPTSGRPSHRGISAPAVGTMQAGSPSSTYSSSVSTSPSNPYNPPHVEFVPYAMPTRASSVGVYCDTSQNAALGQGAWGSVTGSASETDPTDSFSPSPVDDRSPRWHQGQFDEQNTANDYPSGGDSSPSNASHSASDSGSSPTQYSSISMVPPHRCSLTSNSPTRTLRKNKMHTCKVCQKQFPRPSGLNTHMNTHTGDRPHRCEEPGCDKRFTVLSNMRRHMKSHGYERPSQSNPNLSSTGIEFEEPVVGVDHQIAGGIPPLLRWVSSQSGPTTRQSDGWVASGHESPPRSETSPGGGPSSGIHPAGPSSTKLEEHGYLYQRPRRQ